MSDLPRRADVVVIGGGIIGTASAFFLSRLGLHPVLIERLPALAGLATAQSMEAFRAQFVEPENVSMMCEGIGFYERFGEETGLGEVDLGLRQQGYLFLTTQPDGPERYRARVVAQHALGVSDVEYLEPEEVHRRFPFVTGDVTAATYRAQDGWLSAHEAAYGFVRASRATVVLDVTATGFRTAGGRLQGVETDQGAVATPLAIIACGPYSKNVAGFTGVDLPLENVRRHRVTIGGHPLIPQHAPMTIDQDTGAHWRPESGGAALAWAQVHERPQPAMDRVHPDPNFPFAVLEGVARLCNFWEAVGDSLRANQVHLGAGQYTLTPDDKPIVGQHPFVEGLYFNAGYGGHGVMAAPGGGALLARLISGTVTDATNPFSYRRMKQIEASDTAQRRML